MFFQNFFVQKNFKYGIIEKVSAKILCDKSVFNDTLQYRTVHNHSIYSERVQSFLYVTKVRDISVKRFL